MLERLKKIFTKDTPQPYTKSELEISQLLNYVQNTGDKSLIGMYGVTAQGAIRNESVHFAVFFRVITLLSSVIAQLITNGHLRVLDRQGEVVDTTSARNVLDLLQYSPDGVIPASQFIEDIACDYLIDGNALIAIDRTMGDVTSLKRLESSTAYIDLTSDKQDLVYRAHDGYNRMAESPFEAYASFNIIHCRWPLLISGSSVGHRAYFATAPVALMRPAMAIGLESDKYILDWYKTDSPKSNVGISFEDSLQPEQLEQLRSQLDSGARSRAPLLIGNNAKFTNLNNTSTGAGSSQAEQREFQVGEICRIYGVPGPLVNQQVTSWGSGIEQLSRLAFRFSMRQHVDRILNVMKFKLLPKGFTFSIDEMDLLRGDTAGIAAIIRATRGDAQSPEIATIEEQRMMAGLQIKPQYGELKPLQNSNTGGSNGSE